MEISFTDLKNKDVINITDGKKLGHIVDIVFDSTNGQVTGIIVPGDKKLFRKNDDIFVPLARLKKIGNDVIIVSLQLVGRPSYSPNNNVLLHNVTQNFQNSMKYYDKGQSQSNNVSYVRYKRIDNKKYK